MNYGVILASGKGKRVKDNINIPKQFRELNGIPIIFLLLFLRNMLIVLSK